MNSGGFLIPHIRREDVPNQGILVVERKPDGVEARIEGGDVVIVPLETLILLEDVLLWRDQDIQIEALHLRWERQLEYPDHGLVLRRVDGD